MSFKVLDNYTLFVTLLTEQTLEESLITIYSSIWHCYVKRKYQWVVFENESSGVKRYLIGGERFSNLDHGRGFFVYISVYGKCMDQPPLWQKCYLTTKLTFIATRQEQLQTEQLPSSRKYNMSGILKGALLKKRRREYYQISLFSALFSPNCFLSSIEKILD